MILIRPPHDQSRWLSELTVLFLHTAPLLLPLHPWNSPLKALACWLSGESQPLDINLPSPQIKQISFTPTLPVEYWLLNGKQLDLTFINNQKVILEPLWNHSFCSFSFFLSFFFAQLAGSFFPNQGWNLGPQQWEHRVLTTTGPLWNSPRWQFLTQHLTIASRWRCLMQTSNGCLKLFRPFPTPLPLLLHTHPQRDRLPLAPLSHLWQYFSVLQGWWTEFRKMTGRYKYIACCKIKECPC